MKLLVKTNLYTLTVTLILFSIGAFIIYREIIVRFDNEANGHLLSAKHKIIDDLNEGVPPEDFFAKIDQKNYIREIKTQTLFNDVYSTLSQKDKDLEEEDEEEGEEEIIYKVLLFQTRVKDKIYEIRIFNSLSEGKEIRRPIMNTVIIFLIISTILLLILNQFISKFIWKPFNSSVNSIKKWDFSRPLDLEETNIYEFGVLNSSLKELTERIKLDYSNLKEFTENISHETQTPLTILSNKLELLLQKNNYTPEQAALIQESYSAVQRLFKLNKTLILLSKIENHQFLETQKFNLKHSVDEKINEFEDFIESKNIKIERLFLQDINLEINPVLMNVLLDNLFLNAIKYNSENDGLIRIKIENNALSIANSSFIGPLENKFLFERINKNSTSGSLGIGLSLLKKITDFYSWKITYSYRDSLHIFLVTFK